MYRWLGMMEAGDDGKYRGESWNLVYTTVRFGVHHFSSKTAQRKNGERELEKRVETMALFSALLRFYGRIVGDYVAVSQFFLKFADKLSNERRKPNERNEKQDSACCSRHHSG